MVLRVIRPICEMPECPRHRFQTYMDYLKDSLRMNDATLDLCPIYRRDGDTLNGVQGNLVDDTNCAFTPVFAAEKNPGSFHQKMCTN